MVAEPWKYSKREIKSFAWKVACEKWYSEKSALVLDQMKAFVDEGDVLARIIDSVYMKGANTKKSNLAMQLELDMGHTKYFWLKRMLLFCTGS